MWLKDLVEQIIEGTSPINGFVLRIILFSIIMIIGLITYLIGINLMNENLSNIYHLRW